MFVRLQMALISPPVVRVVAGDPKWGKQGFKFLEHHILTFTKHISQDGISGVVNRVPQPALVGFVADIRPLFVQFGLTGGFQPDGQLAASTQLKHVGIHLHKIAGLFFNVLMTVFLSIFSTRAVSRMPLPLIAISSACSLMPGSYAR